MAEAGKFPSFRYMYIVSMNNALSPYLSPEIGEQLFGHPAYEIQDAPLKCRLICTEEAYSNIDESPLTGLFISVQCRFLFLSFLELLQFGPPPFNVCLTVNLHHKLHPLLFKLLVIWKVSGNNSFKFLPQLSKKSFNNKKTCLQSIVDDVLTFFRPCSRGGKFSTTS